MAHPKRQHSVQRQRKRRTHLALKLATLQDCPHCGKRILSHRVCPFCGYYKGTMIVDVAVKKEKPAKS